ncbi:Glycosyl hydrolase family 26 [compost metagenome]
MRKEYEELVGITPTPKLAAIGEIGPIPSIRDLSASRIPWLWFMTWSQDFARTEKFTTNEELRSAYNCDYAITLDKLPQLY